MDAPADFPLFPPLEPYRNGMFPVDDLHTLYWEECGNPQGVPVVYVHGGPGGGASPEKRRWFDPDHYRIVLYDQRGSYRSTPLAEERRNTTQLLVEDMEALRRMLGIEKWLIAGGSWGTTLSLTYGQTYPASCLGFVLRGVFLGSRSEIEWFLNGMKLFFPWAYPEFLHTIPEEERNDLLAAYVTRVLNPDPAVHMPAARAWFRYSESCSQLRYDKEMVEEASKNVPVVFGTGKLDAFYFSNQMFLHSGQVLANMHRIKHLPAVIVQGGHDVIATPSAAYQLHLAWPGSLLHIIPDAGHAPSEPGIRAKLIETIEHYKREGCFC